MQRSGSGRCGGKRWARGTPRLERAVELHARASKDGAGGAVARGCHTSRLASPGPAEVYSVCCLTCVQKLCASRTWVRRAAALPGGARLDRRRCSLHAFVFRWFAVLSTSFAPCTSEQQRLKLRRRPGLASHLPRRAQRPAPLTGYSKDCHAGALHCQARRRVGTGAGWPGRHHPAAGCAGAHSRGHRPAGETAPGFVIMSALRCRGFAAAAAAAASSCCLLTRPPASSRRRTTDLLGGTEVQGHQDGPPGDAPSVLQRCQRAGGLWPNHLLLCVSPCRAGARGGWGRCPSGCSLPDWKRGCRLLVKRPDSSCAAPWVQCRGRPAFSL